MTTMGSQFQDFELSPSSFLNKKPKKVTYGNFNFQPALFNKARGASQRGNINKFCPPLPIQHRSGPQAQGSHYNTKRLSNDMNQVQIAGKFADLYDITKNVKGCGSNGSPDKLSWSCYASTASESDSSSHASSELSGFKIVHGGKVVHDETEEEPESPFDFETSLRVDVGNGKFASSGMVIGPHAKEISIPSFA